MHIVGTGPRGARVTELRRVRFWPYSRAVALTRCWLNHFSIKTPLTPSPSSCMSKNSGQIFSKEIMKFLKLLGRGTLYHLFSLPLSLSPQTWPQWVPPSCSCAGLQKAFATLNTLFKTSVRREHCISAKRLLIQLVIWGRETCPTEVVEMLWNILRSYI